MRPALLACALLLFSRPTEARKTVVADLIFHNGTIHTLDADFSTAEALAVKDGRILAVGSEGEVMRLAGPGTRKVDLDGRALIPGFVDPHTHIFNDAESIGLTFAEAQALALKNGITTLGDMFSPPWFVDDMLAFDAAGELRLRTSLYLVRATNCGDLHDAWRSHPINRDVESRVRIPGIKIFADGGSCFLAAVSFPVDLGDGPTFGDLFFDQATMDELVAEADAEGWQVAIHAIGDRGRDVALTALDHVLDGRPNVLRHRIEHASWVRPDQIEPLVRNDIGLTDLMDLTCQINQGFSPFVNQAPASALSWYRPQRTLLAAGVRLSFSTDYPFRTDNTAWHLHTLVTRAAVDTDDGSVCEPQPFTAAESVSLEHALRMMTLTPAYLLGMDSVVGSLEPGKFADVIVLSADPFAIDPQELRNLVVLSTTIGGEPLYCALGSEDLCR